ncbi:MAG TPA: sulfatase-like hydrolase/transferase [Coxiellaceae bacterium]|nr:MAG: hypothetical protein A3E81_01035 [Gammaproteobacteria bacterium RIFCSPHIGHO2_12_FULL_36_30]HLB56746.1 sulfatase-like hydrolase/transferase [Coxiellaceae bacterium]
MYIHKESRQWLFTLIFLNTIILCGTSIPAMYTDPIPHAISTILFYSVCCIAQNFFFSIILGIVVAPIFFFTRSDRLKIILSLLPIAITIFICFVNAKVYSFWRLYANASLVRMYFSKGGGSQIFEVHDTMYAWIALAVVLIMLLSFIALIVSKKLCRPFPLKIFSSVFIFIYIFSQITFIIFITENNMQFLQYTLKVPYFYDLSWAHALEKMDVKLFPRDALSPDLRHILSDQHALDYPLHPLQYHLPKKPLNVLLIVVDTLRYDMINPTNMPNVYRFAQHADQFLDNLSGGDCTRPGIFSLFYGIPATYWDAAILHHQGSILIRALQANHYQLGLYASAPLISPPFDQTVFATVKHFQEITPGATPMLRDDEITHEMQQFLNHAAQNKKPFFGFLFYDAPHAYNAIPLHHPFSPIAFLNYFSINNDTPITPIYNLYKNSVFADDQLLEKIFQTLQKNNLMQNTVVIITADHGQEFNDYNNNYWEHASGFSKYQLRTPMIIAWPNRTPKKYFYQTTHFDLVPTILKRVLGVINPTIDYSIGDDFFSKNQPKTVITGNYAYFAFLDHDKIMQFHESGLYRFTNLEMKPLHDEKATPSDYSRLLKKMTAYG